MTDPHLLAEKSEQPLLALCKVVQRKTVTIGLAWLSLASGALKLMEFTQAANASEARLQQELERIVPAEILLADGSDIALQAGTLAKPCGWRTGISIFPAARKHCWSSSMSATLSGFGAEGLSAAIGAAGALLRYAQATQGKSLQHVRTLTVESENEFIGLDAATRRNLEISETMRGQDASAARRPCFRCSTIAAPRWVHACCATGCTMPAAISLVAQARIAAITALLRQDAGDALSTAIRGDRRHRTHHHAHRAGKRPSARLGRPARQPAAIAGIARAVARSDDSRCRAAGQPARSAGNARPTVSICWHAAIDAGAGHHAARRRRDRRRLRCRTRRTARAVRECRRNFCSTWKPANAQRTGIANLRVEYNRVHGFYIEVTRGQTDKVPDDYRRRQTLKNAERYITPELKAFEDKALSAQERALAREKYAV